MMDSPETVFALVLVLALGVGIILTVVAVILSGINWWDKL